MATYSVSIKIKIGKTLYRDILVYYTGYKASIGIKTLHIVFSKINECIENNNGGNLLKKSRYPKKRINMKEN